MTVRSHFQAQAAACAQRGSPFTARLLELAAERLDETRHVGRAILRWPGNPKADALALRLAAALHALVLSGVSPELAAVYPGGPHSGNPAALGPALTRAFEAQGAVIADFLARPPQTNEVGRSAVLLGGFLSVAAETGLPLRLLELGASAGLNLFWDAYAYDLAGAAWGPPDAPLRLCPDWQGTLPPLVPAVIRSRRGCDRTPLDPSDAGDRLRLRAYVWADQVDRRHRLEVALDLVAGSGVRVERADAAQWAEARLSERAPGEAVVLYHSIVWQYLPPAVKRRIAAAIERAAAGATSPCPLAWLRMEPARDARHAELRLTLWPGGHERLLAEADYHGRWIRWLATRRGLPPASSGRRPAAGVKVRRAAGAFWEGGRRHSPEGSLATSMPRLM
ncbi:MAG: DUF2332 domain-containing protein [Geminicoccaceae bacterium]